MQLIVDNSTGELMPGDYASIHLQIAGAAHVLSVPSSALIFDAKGLSIATVDANNRVLLKPVTIPARPGAGRRTRLRDLLPSDRVDSKTRPTESAVARRCASPAAGVRRRARRNGTKKNEAGLRTFRCLARTGAAAFGACSLAPPLKTPEVPTADAYKGRPGHGRRRSRPTACRAAAGGRCTAMCELDDLEQQR